MSTIVRMLTVTDLHQSQPLYAELSGVVARMRPQVLALVGDFLDCSGMVSPQLTARECAIVIARFKVPEVVFVRGNHEDDNWLEFASAWRAAGRKLVRLHGETQAFGPLVLTGFPCYLGNDLPFAGDQRELPYNPDVWLSDLVKRHGPAIRTLWLMHEPPAGTPLSAPNTPVAGNSDWTRVIERHSPLLTISGHDHLTPRRTGQWLHRLGSTVCVNLGQTDHGPLHWCWIEAEFGVDSPSLPVALRVTGFPRGESVEVAPASP